jgi:hypothetical protein
VQAEDAVEFLQALLDGLPKAHIEFFRGHLTRSFESLEMPFRSSTDEPFWTLSLAVEGVPSFEQSIRAFYQDEIISDYFAEPLDQRIAARHAKRTAQGLFLPFVSITREYPVRGLLQ